MSTPRYTDKQKIAYYKKLALGASAPAPARRVAIRKPARTYTRRATTTKVYKPRAAPALKGYGAYSTKESKKEKGIGERVGSTLGAGIGKGIQMLVKHITGFGEYNVEYNSLMEGGLSPPQIVNSAREGGVIVRHREYLGDIDASVNFTLQAYALNPGLVDSFPWLSGIANSFEQYRWRGVVYEFISLSSDSILSASTSSALGAVIMATEYNSINPNFANKAEMENHEFANSRRPSINFMHPVECKKSLTSVDMLYTRSGAVPAGADIRLYDLGKMEIATVGMQAASGVAGELWVTYEVELFKPQLEGSTPPDSMMIKTDVFHLGSIVNPSLNPLGTSAVPVNPSFTANLGGVITTAASGGIGTYTFPASAVGETFLILYTLAGTSVVTNAPGYTLSGGTVVQMFVNATGNSTNAPQTGSTATRYMYATAFKPSSSAATFRIDAAGTLPANSLADLYVTVLAPGVFEQMQKMLETPDEDSDEESLELPEDVKKYLASKGIKL